MLHRFSPLLLICCFAIVANAAEEDICFDAVNGKVAWNRDGSTGWDPSNIQALCRGTNDHRRTIACFQDIIKREDNWQKGIEVCTKANAESLSINKASQAPDERKPTYSPPKRTFLKDLVCTTRNVSIADNLEVNYVGKSEALRKVLVPGTVLHLDDLTNGSFAALGSSARLSYPIYVNFNDRTVNLTGSEDDLFAIKDRTDNTLHRTADGTLRGAQSAISSLVASRPNNANFASSFEVLEVTSDEQLNIAMNGAVSYNGFDFGSTFKFNQSSDLSKIVGQFIQRYYAVTVDFTDIDNGPEGWFVEDVIPDLRAAEQERGPLVFIDSVVYGHAAYFYTETSKSDLAVAATLHAAYEGAGGSAEGDASTDYESHFSSDKLKVISIGGGNLEGVVVNSIDDFKRIVTEKPPATGLGDAIAYTVRFVDDHSLAMTHVATEFPERTCTPLSNKVSFGFDKITVNHADDEGRDNAIEVRGTASVRVEYDAFKDGEGWVIKKIPAGEDKVEWPPYSGKTISFPRWRKLDINEALGLEGTSKYIDRFLEFDIPDDPNSEDINESKTARFIVSWSEVLEDDGDKPRNRDDTLLPMNQLDGGRELTLLDIEKDIERPYFRFRGEDQQSPDADVQFHFYLKPAK